MPKSINFKRPHLPFWSIGRVAKLKMKIKISKILGNSKSFRNEYEFFKTNFGKNPDPSLGALGDFPPNFLAAK